MMLSVQNDDIIFLFCLLNLATLKNIFTIVFY
jgi:hypothetical protein